MVTSTAITQNDNASAIKIMSDLCMPNLSIWRTNALPKVAVQARNQVRKAIVIDLVEHFYKLIKY